jgi:hypothetical protein
MRIYMRNYKRKIKKVNIFGSIYGNILKGFDVKINYLLEIIIRYLVLGCLKHLIHHL